MAGWGVAEAKAGDWAGAGREGMKEVEKGGEKAAAGSVAETAAEEGTAEEEKE